MLDILLLKMIIFSKIRLTHQEIAQDALKIDSGRCLTFALLSRKHLPADSTCVHCVFDASNFACSNDVKELSTVGRPSVSFLLWDRFFIKQPFPYQFLQAKQHFVCSTSRVGGGTKKCDQANGFDFR